MTSPLDPVALAREELPLDGDGLPPSVHVFEEDDLLAINAALVTTRPLLVRGEPGTGKSQLARAAAVALGRAFVHYTVNANTDTRDLLFQIDAVARLAEAQLLSATRDVDENVASERLALERFTAPGPVWWALDPRSAAARQERAKAPYCVVPDPARAVDQGVVVLVDEIDKADEAVPNGLLDALGDRRFSVPGRQDAVALGDGLTPLVVITTNEERALPDAFLRRCWVRHLTLPEDEEALAAFIVRRGRAHFPDVDEAVLARAAALLVRDRGAVRGQPIAPPGMAEYVDLVRAVRAQHPGNTVDQRALLERIAKFALRKHPGLHDADDEPTPGERP